MECPHLESGVARDFKGFKFGSALKCSGCQAKKSIWMCTTCGERNCGRYVKGHALAHYEKAAQTAKKSKDSEIRHSVCIDCEEMAVYCYACDDFVVNDTPDNRLEKIRAKLLAAPSKSDDKSGGEKVENARSLRPRRRRSLEDAGSVENRPSPAKKLRKDTKAKNLVGLRNLGNTCFMSAVLQSLGNIHEFCRVLKQLPSLDDLPSSKSSSSSSSSSASSTHSCSSPNPGSNLRETRSNPRVADGPIMTEELRKVLVALNQGQSRGLKVISPEALFLVIWKVVPRFRGYQQQDAHEFLRYMLDRLHTELLHLLPGELVAKRQLSPYARRRRSTSTTSHSSVVTSIFGGMLQSEVTCLSCKTPSKKHDPFLDLSIDIPPAFANFRKAKMASDGHEPRPCQLYDCLQKFVDVEELAESERFFCNSCKSKQRSTKRFWIRRLPNVLCLHIKRFRWSPYSRTKLDTHVEFPLSGLDMSKYLLSNLHETRCSNAGSSQYDLAAVIVHHGSGAGSGHYTAFVTKNNEWYHFNDSTVSATNVETVQQCKAYILFYIQREFRLPPMI